VVDASNPIAEYRKSLIDENFKNSLLYACYNFYETYHNKPESYKELQEFIKLREIENLVENYKKLIDNAKQGTE
jgi:hypothetical protein